MKVRLYVCTHVSKNTTQREECLNFLTQSNTKIQKINFFIHFDSQIMILCPYDFIT